MRPHTFATLAVFLFFLRHPKEHRYNFYAQILEKRHGRNYKEHDYDFTVLYRTEEVLKLRIGRMWTCEVEIRPEKVGSDKYIIKHNHREYVTEEFEIKHPRELFGEYRSHERFTRFRSYDFTRDALEMVCDHDGTEFELRVLR